MTSNATDSSKCTIDDAKKSLDRVKLDPKNYSVLQLFVENEWEKNAIKDLGEWLWKENARVKCTPREKEFKDKLTSELRNILPFLVTCNDDVKFTDEHGRTILHVYLANSESNYRGTTSDGKSKIFGIVRALMNRGVAVDAADRWGKTPMHIAAETRKLELLRLMSDDFFNPGVCDENGNTVLHSVVEENREEDDVYLDVVRTLLAKSVDPNERNNSGMSALQLVVGNCSVDLLRIFKEYDADFRELTNKHENLLLLAYKNIRKIDDFHAEESTLIAVTNFLVDQGCDVNSQDNDGYSPLHFAITRHRLLNKLLELGADVNCQTKKGQTPLHLAVARKIGPVYGILMDAGACSDVMDIDGRTPLDIALENYNLATIEILLDLGVDINNHCTVDQWRKCYKRARKLVIGQAFKLKMLQFPVDKAYENSLKDGGGWSKLGEYYSREVSKMKTCMISDEFSIFDFLHMNPRRQLLYVDRLPRDLKSQFCFYENIIQRVSNAALLRNRLARAAEMACYEATMRRLPDVCVERVLHFLNNGDLRRLIEATESTTGI